MDFSYISNLLAGRTPDGSKTILEAIVPLIVKVTSFETRDYEYYADKLCGIYDCDECTDLGVWYESPDED